jgi:hypothetical protein
MNPNFRILSSFLFICNILIDNILYINVTKYSKMSINKTTHIFSITLLGERVLMEGNTILGLILSSHLSQRI